MDVSKNLTSEEQDKIIEVLKLRFEKNMHRHKKIEWDKIEKKIKANPQKLWSLHEMEKTGGEPDVVGFDPKNRRSVCYDREALESRKEHKPKNNAVDMAAEMCIELLDENKYRELQKIGKFDTKTSSWIKTPPAIRKHGGALFCDCRYDHVFVYHNGAESYYAARGFRGLLRV